MRLRMLIWAATSCALVAAVMTGCGPRGGGWNCGLEAPVCMDVQTSQVCDGSAVVIRPCSLLQVCVDGEGCVTKICEPGTKDCKDLATELECVDPGHEYRENPCQTGIDCTPLVGCEPPVCDVGDTICLDTDTIGNCRADRTGYDPAGNCSDQGPNLVCLFGECVSRCEVVSIGDSSLGIEYYAVDLPQYNLDKDYAIIVSNPSGDQTAHVEISTINGVETTLDVPPKELRTYVAPVSRPMNIASTGVWARAYRISSNIPVAAFQFNSLTTVGAASTDASLLFNTLVLATKYWVLDYTGFSSDTNFVAVYATEPATTVEVTPSTNILASTAGSLETFVATTAGQMLTVTLDPYEVLVVIADGAQQNLSGTMVEASAPIGVFAGCRCTQVPFGTMFCDHIEQQIFPRQAIGNRYVVAKTHPRTSCTVVDHLRILADIDETTVTLDPPVDGPFTLAAGEWVETTILDSVQISANNPIMVGQYIRSSNGSECDDEGDPAFILQVPVEQFRCEYVFLTPETYDTDYVSIVATPGTYVEMDGQQVTLSTTLVGNSGYTVTSQVVQDGPHVIIADDMIGVIVYGYGGPGSIHSDTQNVSYGYPAGLSMKPINPVE